MVSCQAQNTRFTSEIKEYDQFKNMSSLPLSAKYGNVSSVKVVYDILTQETYYLNSKHFTYHYQFCEDLLNETIDIGDFNTLNYSASNFRRFLLGNINYYSSLKKYVLEISPSDLMTEQQLLLFHSCVSNTLKCSPSIYFLLNERWEQNKNKLGAKIKIIEPSEIYANLSFQAISCAKTTGKLLFIKRGENLDLSDHSKDIVVFQETPLFLPNVRGIIVSEFQTPLSHISILGQNRAIPICASRSIFDLEFVEKYDHQFVSFEVKIDTFSFKSISKILDVTSKEPIQIKKDLSINTLVLVKEITKNSSSFIGNKAMNFGILNTISQKAGFKVPENGFAVPFYFYNQHVVFSKADKKIEDLLKNIAVLSSTLALKKALHEIQDVILKTPVDSKLISLIEKQLKSNPSFTRFRFRSSTNAEDANGFSGAGLYASKTVDLNDPKKSIENGLKKVWASLWSYEAFAERSYFGIEQNDVCMGVLIHRSFPNEAVNGVAITKNIYRKNYIGFVVNAQLGDESVVNPNPGIICDQFVCFPDNNSDFYSESLDVLTYSSLNKGKLIMSKEEIQLLANQLEIIKLYFYKRQQGTNILYSDYGLDVEFKFEEKTRKLYIKQVRFYNN
jgi:pyruvate, water dikinase